MLKDKRDFLYELGGKFYIIGGYVCEECDDNSLIKEYRRFKTLTSHPEFAQHPREMLEAHRDAVADSYERIAKACCVPIESSRLDYEALMLRDELEERFAGEIEKQMEIWVKSLDCKDYRDIKL